MGDERSKHLGRVKRLVVKVGSSLLSGAKGRGIRKPFLGHLAREIRALQDRGLQCIVVTSGAISEGLAEMGLPSRPKEIARLQALAAVGQSNLMHDYEVVFKRSGLKVAQLLLTREDLSSRVRYGNARNTLEELFRYGVVPVVNENDTVAVEEIKFGDNDTLATLVCHLSQADLLVLLTDADGLHTRDPRLDPGAELIREVRVIGPELERSAGPPQGPHGTGGMRTKLLAAKGMMASGIPMVIARGGTRHVLQRLLDGESLGTLFIPAAGRVGSRKRWLAWSVRPTGEVRVDEGACRALLERDSSLLPSGVKGILGHWEKGGVVDIAGPDGRKVARGICNHSSEELERIRGLKTQEAAARLGPGRPPEVVHRDNLVKLGL